MNFLSGVISSSTFAIKNSIKSSFLNKFLSSIRDIEHVSFICFFCCCKILIANVLSFSFCVVFSNKNPVSFEKMYCRISETAFSISSVRDCAHFELAMIMISIFRNRSCNFSSSSGPDGFWLKMVSRTIELTSVLNSSKLGSLRNAVASLSALFVSDANTVPKQCCKTCSFSLNLSR